MSETKTKKKTNPPKVEAPKVELHARNVLFAAGEAGPFLRSGGLGDVAAALPQALKGVGVETRVIMPLYSKIPKTFTDTMRFVGKTYVGLGWRNQYVGVFESNADGVTYYFIDNEYYFNRNTMYGQFDDAERYAFFAKAVLEAVANVIDFAPDVIHCNDWHTGLIPVFLDVFYRAVPKLSNVKTVYTIHNIEFQGKYDLRLAREICALPEDKVTLVEYGGCLNMMKGAIECANAVTTVSPTYANELQESFYAYDLDGILRDRRYKISGIINGIDTKLYDPATDSSLFVNFDRESRAKREDNKKKLCGLVNLPYREGVPIICMVTRMTTQKGFDLVLAAAEELLDGEVQMVILGTGEWKYESAFKDLEHRYGSKLRLIINFSKDLASKLYGSCDIFLMPSKFEPCGLSQMIAMRYGCIPVVRETGGLKDTVFPFNPETKEGRGFTFYAYDSHEMLGAIWRAVDTYYNDKKGWDKLIDSAMSADFGWESSAKEYAKLYDSLL
ncbi:MAG: glycogen synthase GlgA [Clostridia bacterium]|nr:glycogen synthase GlgA [Clostridia bacterium]